MTLTATDSVHAVQAGQHKFHATSADRLSLAGVDLERLVPGRRNAFQSLRILAAWQHVADFNSDALAEHFGDLSKSVLFDVFREHDLNRRRRDMLEDLLFGHLMAAHQIEFQLAQRTADQMT